MGWREQAAMRNARQEAAKKLDGTWEPLGRFGAWQFNRELKRELTSEHKLAGEHWSAIGRDTQSDDVLFASETGKLAKVHLTWKRETNPAFPSAVFVSSIEEMMAQAEEEAEYIARLIEEEERCESPAPEFTQAEPICNRCGANWSKGEAHADCAVCDGFGLTRPCPVCGGKCGTEWKRAVLDSNDAGEAHWVGRCASLRCTDS